MVQLTIEAKSKQPTLSKLPYSLESALTKPVKDIQEKVAKHVGLSSSRIRLYSASGIVLPENNTLADCNLNTHKLYAKDLGPQIGWRTVFYIEYIGPLVIHPLIYFFSKQIYGVDFEHTKEQKIALIMAILHYLKRELETMFVHKFSASTMPFRNVFKNSFHYWVIGGLSLAYFVYSPAASTYTPYSDSALKSISVFWLFCELSNLANHISLSNLRPKGTNVRKIPKGYGFNLVSCPNYFFESLGWAAYAVLTKSVIAWLFFAISTAQMYIWAVKKHRRYRKDFGSSYPKSRKAMFPFIA
ncbi:hypothetical protein CANCADRAFT_148049 [Tortispora caseinolytica NRRL Y-17796]|uniref:very-long-chain enoyl-CoA reductase n=1 Tax=Tortispora caseinolytica NRRL Y-17796 TaxID=767744 RepID=A0A1E4TG87_9ASCO|nr:hypothetical protein CANCADRAFT_148049 [Tortispora caseinolytica NRRL Y-17796]